ncbi:unnamed protein product [Diamesa tonsa]
MRFQADKSAINSLEPPVIINTYGTGVHVTQTKPQNCRQWIEYFQKMKPQTNAMSAGLVLMIFNGIHLGWGIFNNHLRGQPWAAGEDEGLVFWSIASWFIAAIVGFFLTALLVKRTSKTTLYVCASILAAISSGLFYLYPLDPLFIFIGRLLAGVSHGITYITVLIHGCEIAVPKIRGYVLTTIHLCLLIGVFTFSTNILRDENSLLFDANKQLGLYGLVYVGLGLILGLFLTRESPVFLIQQKREQDAIDIMIRLRSASSENRDICNDFDEFKTMLIEDAQSDEKVFDPNNRNSLFLIILLRISFVMSFNMPLNMIWLRGSAAQFDDSLTDPSAMFLSGLRFVVTLVVMFAVDSRKKMLVITSTGLLGAIFLLMAILFKFPPDVVGPMGIMFMASLFHFFGGLGIGTIGDIYSSEAFNTTNKPASIAFTSAIEFTLQLLLIFITFYVNISYFAMMTIFCIIMFLVCNIIVFYLPETGKMSLREARNQFYK